MNIGMFKLVRYIFALPITLYQRYISPILPSSCRYHPSCSEYTKISIMKFGILKGSLNGLLRILRCNAFFKGGFDPVQPRFIFKNALRKFKKFY